MPTPNWNSIEPDDVMDPGFDPCEYYDQITTPDDCDEEEEKDDDEAEDE